MDKHPAIQAFLAEYREQSRRVERELREWSEPKMRELREQVGRREGHRLHTTGDLYCL